MDVERVVSELQKLYPDKKIVKNKNRSGDVVEVICEVEPGKNKSVAIAIVEKSIPHFHKQASETYEVIRGQITLHKNGRSYFLQNGDSITIKPGEIHSAEGKGAWIKVISEPGWNLMDHVIKN